MIVYRPSNSDQTHSVQVDDAEATSYIIESVMTETEYTVQMIAYMELSTSLSNSATVYLDGKCNHGIEHVHTYMYM